MPKRYKRVFGNRPPPASYLSAYDAIFVISDDQENLKWFVGARYYPDHSAYSYQAPGAPPRLLEKAAPVVRAWADGFAKLHGKSAPSHLEGRS